MPRINLVPMWQTTDGESVRLYHGDALEVLKTMPGSSVQCIITSPAYWGLRDYGTRDDKEIGREENLDCEGWMTRVNCGKCHICRLRQVFNEAKRVLMEEGSLFIVYGDVYSQFVLSNDEEKIAKYAKPGDSLCIPQTIMLSFKRDGWIFRQDIIWHKPNGLPDSVDDRFTRCHEYILHFTKSRDYYFDKHAITDDYKCNHTGRIKQKNKRSVWTVNASNYPGTHFATYSVELIEPLLLGATSEYGACAQCNSPYKRIIKESGRVLFPKEEGEFRDRSKKKNRNGIGGHLDGIQPDIETVGWEKSCLCRDCDIITPCRVLDIYMGAGTTAIACIKHKRRCWGIELSKKYILLNQIPRIEGELMSRPSYAHLIPSS